MWFATAGLFGLDVAVARMAGKRIELAPLARTAVMLSTLTGTLTTAAAYLFIPRLLPSAQHHLLPLAYVSIAIIPLNHVTLHLQAVEQGAGHFTLLNISRASFYPVYLLALIALWLLRVGSLYWIVGALVASNAAVLIVLLFARARDLVSRSNIVDPWNIVREGSRYGLVSLGNLLHQRVDQILLLWLLPTRDLGLYVVALSAGSVVSIAASSMSIVCFTQAAQARLQEDFVQVARTFRQAVIISAAAAMALVPALPVLLPLIYGDAFASSVHIAMLLVTGSVAAGLAQVLDASLRGQGRPYAGLAGRMCAIAVMCAVGAICIYLFGLVGIALAFVVSQLSYMVVLAFSVLKNYHGATVAALVPTTTDLMELLISAKGLIGKIRYAGFN
jgi:O-antigen/teichoic acid export membrane protein